MLKTFKIGGIHPADSKLSAGRELQVLQLPQEVTIPVAQHIGAPAQPVVAVGDNVKIGQLIAAAQGFVSANVHSSVCGTVKKIDTFVDAAGLRKPCITIAVEGNEWVEGIDTTQGVVRDIKLSPKEIVDRIAECGLVGMGGATFPSHVKLSIPEGKHCDTLIINAVECEPYLTADHQLMLQKGEEIFIGIKILMKALCVERAFIGIENNKRDAIESLGKLSGSYPGIEVVALRMRYPQGGEKQLIDACIGRQVPSGKLPIDVGAVVQNVGTAFAVYEAVQKHKPLIERVVCVTGKPLQSPGNYVVRIGTPIRYVIEAAGGFPDDCQKVIGGGPMMGRTYSNLDVPVMKGTSGILLMSAVESRRQEPENCIRCAKCASACPMGLEPHLMSKLAQRNMIEEANAEHIMDCIECGSCNYTCPSHRPLLDYVRLGKMRVGAMLRASAAQKK